MPAVGSVTVTRNRLSKNAYQIQLDWIADGAGAVSGHPFYTGGCLTQAKFVPGVAPHVPSAGYNALVNDTDGADTLIGEGASLSDTVAFLSSTIFIGPLSWVDPGYIDLVVSGAGAAARGTVVLLFTKASNVVALDV